MMDERSIPDGGRRDMPEIAGYVVLTVEFFEEEGQWTAHCRELGTATCADTLEDARKAIEDMIGLHLNALEDAGEREAFFERHGIRFSRTRPPNVRRTIRPGRLVESFTEAIPASAG